MLAIEPASERRRKAARARVAKPPTRFRSLPKPTLGLRVTRRTVSHNLRTFVDGDQRRIPKMKKEKRFKRTDKLQMSIKTHTGQP